MFACRILSRASSSTSLINNTIFSRALHVKSIVFSEHGNPLRVLKTEEREIPDTPAADEIYVEMYGAAISSGDISHIRGVVPGSRPSLEGKKGPIVAGSEGSGTVIKVGSNVKNIKVNDWVIPANAFQGTWTTHMSGQESDFLTVPKSHIKQAYAAMLGSAVVADRLLEDFVELKEGDYIIQNNSASGISMMVSQLAGQRGIRTISLASDEKNYDDLSYRVKNLGSYIVAPYGYVESYKFRNLIADLPKPKLALNSAGGSSATELARVLAPGGTLVTFGAKNHKGLQLAASSLMLNNISARGFWFPRWLESTSHRDKQAIINSLVPRLAYTKQFGRYFLLEDYVRAVIRFGEEGRSARVLLTTKHVDPQDMEMF